MLYRRISSQPLLLAVSIAALLPVDPADAQKS